MTDSDSEMTLTPSSANSEDGYTESGDITDYYTIAIMEAGLDSPTVDNNDMITSFSNPNYGLNDADALNSNLPPSTQYYDNDSGKEDGLYSTIKISTEGEGQGGGTTSTKKSRKKYAQMDLTSMGISTSDAESCLTSPDFMMSPDSAMQSPLDKSENTTSSATTTSASSDSGLAQHRGGNTEDDTEDDTPYMETKSGGGGFLGYYASLEMSAKQRQQQEDQEEEEVQVKSQDKPAAEETEKTSSVQQQQQQQANYDKTKVINSPDSNDSGIQADVQHTRGPVNPEDLYAVVQKGPPKPLLPLPPQRPPPQQEAKEKGAEASQDKEEEEEDQEIPFEVLPPGWEKHNDESGPYYWHIKSGTIQREPPQHPTTSSRQASTSSSTSQGDEAGSSKKEEAGGEETKPLLQEFEGHALKYATESLKTMQTANDGDSEENTAAAASSTEATSTESTGSIRFAVRSLGWVRIAEEDLTPERSSKAVNKCIVDLSLGRNDINDVVGRWGDGKDLFMDLDDKNLSLTDPQDSSMLNIQPIRSIRVWGVGRDNGRDFAYVARDRSTRKHMCHVFRCDTPARQIANTLRDICKKIMMQEQLQQGLHHDHQHQQASGGSNGTQQQRMSRPTNLPNLVKEGGEKITFADLYRSASFPTPMEEPKKVIRCHYLGTAHVSKPTDQKASVDILNSAMEKIYARVPPEKWVFSSVAVAPSTVTITEHAKPDNILAECRVRFLSFMGIAMRNVKLCSFIMHTAQDQFVAHVFHCEPSAGALCKTIEAACKLRYQKCLDAHQIQMENARKQAAAAAAQQHTAKSPSSSSAAASSSSPQSPPATATSAGGRLASQLKAGVHNMFGMIKKKTSS